MVSARNEFGPVLEHDAICRLDRGPVIFDRCRRVAAVPSAAHGADDAITDAQICQSTVATVGHQDGSVAPLAVTASMRASTVRINGKSEGHPRRSGHLVDRGLRVDL